MPELLVKTVRELPNGNILFEKRLYFLAESDIIELRKKTNWVKGKKGLFAGSVPMGGGKISSGQKSPLTEEENGGIIIENNSNTTKSEQGRIGKMGEEKSKAVSAQSVLNEQKTKSIIKRGIAEKEPIFDNGILGERARFFKREDGYFDVTMHGSSKAVDFFGEKIDSHTLAQILKGRSDYHGEPIRLLSCNTGKSDGNYDCFAQRLANEIKASVKAPNNYLWAHPVNNGISEITIGTTAIDNNGSFVEFQPHFK